MESKKEITFGIPENANNQENEEPATLKTKKMRRLHSSLTMGTEASSASSEEITIDTEVFKNYVNNDVEFEAEKEEEEPVSDDELFSDFLANVGNMKYPMELSALMMEYGKDEEPDDSDSEMDMEKSYKKIEDLSSKKKKVYQPNIFVSRPYWFRMVLYFFLGNPFLLIPLILAIIIYDGGVNIDATSIPWYENRVLMRMLLSYISYFLVIGYSSFILAHVIIKIFRLYIQSKTNFSNLDHYPEYLKRIHIPLTASLLFMSLLISWNVLVRFFCNTVPSETCNTVLSTGSKVLIGLLVSSGFWSIEKILLQMTAVRFHSKPYEDRILENRKTSYVISQLKHIPKKIPPTQLQNMSNATRKNFRPKELQDLELPIYVDPSAPNSIDKGLNKRESDYLSTSSSKSLASATGIGRIPSKFSKFYNINTFARYLTKRPDKSQTTLNKILKKTRSSTDIIFAKCSQKDRNYLIVEDFYKYFKTKKFAKESFAIFDNLKSGKVTKKQMNLSILQSLIEKNHIMKSLLDLEDVLSVIDNIYLGIMFFILFFTWLAIFELPVQSLLSITLSLIAATVFVVADAAKSTFSSIIFLFSLHPYDVGDKVLIDGEQLLVYKIHLLATVFRQTDGQELYIPNQMLAMRKIVNQRRSPDTWESFTFNIDYDTRPDVIQTFKIRVEEFLANSSEDFYPSLFFAPMKILISNTIEICISVQHKSNWQNGNLRWTRHTKLLSFMIDTLKSLKIQYYPVSKVAYNNNQTPPLSALPKVNSMRA